MGKIKLYWWSGHNFSNMGDEFNRYVIEYVSNKEVIRSGLEDSDILAVGSIITFPQISSNINERENPYIVWGTGSIEAVDIKNHEKFILCALRGPLTYSLFSPTCLNRSDMVFGDPGILAAKIWEFKERKKYSWGIIPHHTQINSSWVKKICAETENSILIDVRNPNIKDVMEKISSCEFIASSSLHGLVFADSYKIPSIWLWDGPLHEGGGWKFYDYISGVNRKLSNNFHCHSLGDLNKMNVGKINTSHFGLVDNLCSRLIKSFPII